MITGSKKVFFTQRDILVDLFVKNGFHAEQRAIIVSLTGYPDYLSARLEKILKETPDLPVFYLHDSAPEGQIMASQMNYSKYSLTQHPIIDLGLFPSDVKLMKIKGLKYMRPSKSAYEIPVDYLRFETLATALTVALAQKTPLGALLAKSETDHDGFAAEELAFFSDFG